MNTIPLFKVLMSPRARDMVGDVLESGYIGQGPMVEKFEAAMSEVYGRPVMGLNSCTSALEMALYLAGVQAGDLVATTPIGCTASVAVIVKWGAVPFWIDVDPITGLMDPHDLRRRVLHARASIKAILSVDWGGRFCDYAALRSIGREIWAPVIQDGAHLGPQSLIEHGAASDYACMSTQAIKLLTTSDGGLLATPDRGTFERGKLLRWYGLDRTQSDRDRCAQNIPAGGSGWKANLVDLNAAIGLANLPVALDALSRHRENAERYHMALRGLPGVTLPPPDPNASWWIYTLLVEDVPAFGAFMSDRGIMTSQVHRRIDAHDAYHFPNGPLLGVDYFAAHEVAIPVGWWLMAEDQQRIVEAVREWSIKRGR